MVKHPYFFLLLLAVTLTACISTALPESEHTTMNTTSSDKPIAAGALSGLYRDAGSNSPVVLIVPGSGPTDLNGNSPLGIQSNVYMQLSDALAAHGISTVRVDKRGMFSSKDAGDPNAVTIDIYAQDYRHWVEVIRAKTNQSCVYMLGHSEGALMVSAASIDNENVCGLILVSGAGRPFGDILREQLKANLANKSILDQAFSAIDRLEKGETIDTATIHSALHPLFGTKVQDFLISILSADPAQVAAAADKDTLIVHGMNDIQTSTVDAQKLADATGGHLVVIDGVNHILKEAPANKLHNIATYSNPDLPVSESVITAIRTFVIHEYHKGPAAQR